MFYWFVKFTLRPLFRVFFRPVVVGQQHIPPSGGALLASNGFQLRTDLTKLIADMLDQRS